MHFLLLFPAYLVMAQADTLTLNNGTNVNGSWVGFNAGRVSFLVDNQIRTYPRAEVAAVVFGSEPATPSAKAEPVNVPANPGEVYLKDDSGALTPLERNTVADRRSGTGARARKYQEMAGSRSPVRLRAGQKMLFAVRPANGVDPATYRLLSLESSQSNRRVAPKSLDFNVFRNGESSYTLQPVEDLTPGEYAFIPANSNDAYCFGVDK